jgi:hypothetical protein
MSQPFYEPGSAGPGLVRAEPGARLYQPPRFGPTSDAAAPGPGHGWPSEFPWAPGYGPAGWGGQPRRGNGMAVAGFVLSFLIGLLGLVFSLIGLRRSREPGRGGHGLAVAGVVISTVNMLIGFLLVATGAGVFGPVDGVVRGTGGVPAATAPAVPVAPTTVAGACHVVVPALIGLQSDLQSSGSEAEMLQKIGALADTVQQQGAAAGDRGFAQDTARLADAFRAALATARNGHAPDVTELERASEQVGFDCGRVGVTG